MKRKFEFSEKDRIRIITETLDKLFPKALTELKWKTPWQLLVSVILSAQATDVGVNKATPALFAKYPTPKDLIDVSEEELDQLVNTLNFHHNKCRSILGAAKVVMEKFRGEIPKTMEELVQIPGVARKTGNVILSAAFGINEGIAVDTHVIRVSGRLGLSDQTTPAKIEIDLMAIFPQEKWGQTSNRLILLGRQICNARKPKCGECPLQFLCPAVVDFTGEPNEYFQPE